VLLRYDKPGRGHFVLLAPGNEPSVRQSGALAMRWFGDPRVIPFDCRPNLPKPVGWYRFTAPPGLRAMIVTAFGKVQAWVDGIPVNGKEQAGVWRFELAKIALPRTKVALRVEQWRGCYGGAALFESIQLECGVGLMSAGDWSKADVLENYSGGAWYRKTVKLTPEQAKGKVTLDLGRVVASAEVHINGHLTGIRIAPPWQVDISKQVKPGENRIEILVFNTLANYYMTIPSGYRGEITSGLLGPVSLFLGGPRVTHYRAVKRP
jgi:hypothetical protein